VAGDQARRGGVVELVDAHQVVDPRDQPLALRRPVLAAPAEREDLEFLAVVQFQQFGDEQSDGVKAQVARQIADAHAPFPPRAARMQRLEGGLRDAFVGEALGCQEV